jgi:hypothetical protein
MLGSRSLSLSLLLLLVTTNIAAQDWPQWGRTAQHDGAAAGPGDRFDRIEAEVVIDPFTVAERQASGFDAILVHYPVPLVDGNDLFLLEKGGIFTSRQDSTTQRWNVKNMRRSALGLVKQWMFQSDWLPVPTAQIGGGPSWEPVFHPALTADAVWVPGAGGTMWKVRRTDGVAIARINPFGVAVTPNIYTAGPPALDAEGNVFYNAIQLDPASPWTADPIGAWLVRIAASGATTIVPFATLVPAPAANAQCTTFFTAPTPLDLPLPPSRNAIAPTSRCGAQRPGINATPAIAPDGTVYTISRAHLNDRYGFLVAVKPDMTLKWSASLRERFNDGCNVVLPPNGTPGGCRADSITGVDPTDNLPGSGRVHDDGTSSPVVLPDGHVLYGAYSRYNYAQGHLMKFSSAGAYLGAYGFGWDVTPAVYSHDGTYSIVTKENRYNATSYCIASVCPPRNISAPNNPESYYITQLNASLQVEWQFKNTETKACERVGTQLVCGPGPSHGFEWCVNAVAVDRFGVVYANSEDGYLYSIQQGGTLRQRIFLDTALGAAYTPLAIGADGKIYTQNNGTLFVITSNGRRRAAGR